MYIKLPAVNINGNSRMQDVKRYLVQLVDAIERAFADAKEDDDGSET